MAKRLIALNEEGRRIGESHPQAKLSNRDIDLIHELAEQGLPQVEIARKFEVSRQCIYKIVHGLRRTHSAAKIIEVIIPEVVNTDWADELCAKQRIVNPCANEEKQGVRIDDDKCTQSRMQNSLDIDLGTSA